jgi:hypothetical protein
MLGLPLFTSLVLSLWEIGMGLLPNSTILFSSIITSSVYLHSLRFAGRLSRRLCFGLPLFISLVLSLREIGFTMFDRFWRIIIRSIYDVRQILVLWFGVLFLFTTTLVLFYHTILRLSSLFTLRRSILTAVMLGLPLSTSLVLSLREIGLDWGFAPTRRYSSLPL